jgi:hypothetical protein
VLELGTDNAKADFGDHRVKAMSNAFQKLAKQDGCWFVNGFNSQPGR